MSVDKRSSKGGKDVEAMISEKKVTKMPERARLLLQGIYQQVKIAESEYNNATAMVAAGLNIDAEKITGIDLMAGEFSHTE